MARWIATSKMLVNVEKSQVIWFSIKYFNSLITVLPILLEGTPLVNVSKQKYLVNTIDSNLTWVTMFLIFVRRWHIVYFDWLSSEGTS